MVQHLNLCHFGRQVSPLSTKPINGMTFFFTLVHTLCRFLEVAMFAEGFTVFASDVKFNKYLQMFTLEV